MNFETKVMWAFVATMVYIFLCTAVVIAVVVDRTSWINT